MNPENNQIPQQQLESEAFQRTKTRIEKSARIKHDIRPDNGQPFDPQRVAEIRDVEKKTSFGEPGLSEMMIDARTIKNNDTRFLINLPGAKSSPNR